MELDDRLRTRRRADRIASTAILALLVLIGGGIYLKGRQTHPADPYAATDVPVPAGLQPAETLLEEYRIAETQVFTPETLYEYINGQAPFYIEYGFRRLTVADYEAGGDAPPLTVELYDMTARRNAYGLFTDTFPPEDEPSEIGNGGYVSGNTAVFWRGPCFVKVRSLTTEDAEELVRRAAPVVADRIPDDSKTLSEFAAFPPEGRIEGALAFVKSSAFGLAHIREAFVADYAADDGGYRLFFCDLDSAEQAAALMRTHAEYAAKGPPAQGPAPGELWGEVEYVGPMFLFARGNLVAGCIGVPDRALAETKARDLLERARIVTRKDSGRGGA